MGGKLLRDGRIRPARSIFAGHAKQDYEPNAVVSNTAHVSDGQVFFAHGLVFATVSLDNVPVGPKWKA